MTSRPGTTALRVDCVGGELVRDRLTPELLGGGAGAGGGHRADSEDVREMRRLRELRRGP